MRMRLFIAIFFLLGVSAFLVVQSVKLFRQQDELRKELADLSSQTEKLTKENAELKLKIEYFSHPENLEKELRSRFNYKKSGENLIILVPEQPQQ